MPKAQVMQEVAILNFFEQAPLDRAEVLFSIVKEKMRARSSANGAAATKKKEARGSRSTETPLPQETEKPRIPFAELVRCEAWPPLPRKRALRLSQEDKGGG